MVINIKTKILIQKILKPKDIKIKMNHKMNLIKMKVNNLMKIKKKLIKIKFKSLILKRICHKNMIKTIIVKLKMIQYSIKMTIVIIVKNQIRKKMIITKIRIKKRLAKNLTKSNRILMKILKIKLRLIKIIFP